MKPIILVNKEPPRDLTLFKAIFSPILYRSLEGTLHFKEPALVEMWEQTLHMWTCPQPPSRQHSLSSCYHMAHGEWRIVEEGDEWEQLVSNFKSVPSALVFLSLLKSAFLDCREFSATIEQTASAEILLLHFQGRFMCTDCVLADLGLLLGAPFSFVNTHTSIHTQAQAS